MVPACTFSCILALILLQVSSTYFMAATHSQQSPSAEHAASVVIIKITQRSDSSATGNGQKSMQFHWKDGRGRWILWRNLCSIWPSPSLSSSCFKKSDLKNIPLLILNRPPCPIVLVYSNFFIISEQETQTILFSNPPPPADDENTYSIWLFPNQILH